MKLIVLTIIELCLSEGISQSVGQSVEKEHSKFCSNFLIAFCINLKAYVGLVLPNQYCPIVISEIENDF